MVSLRNAGRTGSRRGNTVAATSSQISNSAKSRRKKSWSAQKSTGAEAPRQPLYTSTTDMDVDMNIAAQECELDGDMHNVSGDVVENIDSDYDYTRDFARLVPEVRWCIGCGDYTSYSKKAECKSCGQIVCFAGPGSKACLEVVPSYAHNGMSSGQYFICPQCTKKEHWMRKSGGFVTYFGFYDASGQPINVIQTMHSSSFTFFRAPKLPTLGILQVELDEEMLELRIPYKAAKMVAEGFSSGVVTCDDVVKHNLRAPALPYDSLTSPRPLVTEIVKFNFLTPKGATRYEHAITQVLRGFRLMGVDEVVIFLATHADPERGDLHFGPNGTGSQALEVVLPELLPRSIQQWLCGIKSHFFMFVCGSKPLTEVGFRCLGSLVRSNVFNNIFCFPTSHFQPRKAANFTAGFIEQAIYKQVPTDVAVNYVLRKDTELGFHSKILRLSALCNDNGVTLCRAMRYVWTQEPRRPWGLEYPIRCPSCQSLQSFSSLGDLRMHPRLKRWECKGRLGADSDNPGRPCMEPFEIELTPEEARLARGSKEGNWQQHEFKWSERIMSRF